MRIATLLLLAAAALAQSGERLKPDHAPTPYTAEQIRKACGEGRATTWVVTRPGKTIHQTFTFTKCTKEGCVLTITQKKKDGTPLGEPRESKGNWKAFQGHASYPEKETTITSETITTKAGKYECWVYVRTRGTTTFRFYFAKKLPGPPIKMTQETDGKQLYSMVLIAHKPGKEVKD